MKRFDSPVSIGHPVRCTKKELKGTKKCIILENGLDPTDDTYYIIKYKSGISNGTARFENSEKGIALMKKFLKLLEK